MEFIPQMVPDFDKCEADACYEYMLSNGFVTEFTKTKEMEDMIVQYTGAKHCFMVNNGTISLVLGLLALGVKVGDYVVVPNLTMIATANAVCLLGAHPILVDVNDDDLTIGLTYLNDILDKYKPKVIIHVSLNGRCNKLREIRDYCDKYHIGLLEDSAQCMGIFYKGKHLGRYGHIGSFSFSSPKIISTGQGGALITDNDELAIKIRSLKDFGRHTSGGDFHPYFGINCKFTDIQAVIGIEQMKKLPNRVIRKREIWNIYYNRLSKITNMIHNSSETWIPWFVDIYVDDPISLGKYLKENKIGTRYIYPPINTQPIYKNTKYNTIYQNYSNDITEKWSKRGLWLPSSTKLTDDEIGYICDKVEYFLIRDKKESTQLNSN